MMTPAKLIAFAVTLAALFGAAALAGGAIDPDRDPAPSAHGGEQVAHGEVKAAHGDQGGGHAAASDTSAAPRAVRGLAVAEGGLRLVLADPGLRPGRTETLRFRVVDDAGATVRAFDVEHEKRMHLIVARRDLTGFQHVRPAQGRDGGWRVRLRVDEPGSYRVFADFTRDGRAATLATDLRVGGPADLRALPAPAATVLGDAGSTVRLDAGRPRPGEEARLRFAVTRDGRAVHAEPYLGAGGHLVALREGDLAFLHVHPAGHGDAAEGHDDAIGFAATFPTAGRYRLFLQFKRGGRVETAAFTQEVR